MWVLKEEFFERPVLEVAPDLLGKYLVVGRKGDQVGGGFATAHLITEVEAYDGEHDLACHASKGRTKRTEVIFGPAGHWYVYLVYGLHNMLNIVTGPADYPAAVLIRGVEGLPGPGKLTKGLGIERSFNGQLASTASGLWFEDRGVVIHSKDIKTTPRVGVDYAGPEWSKKPWRFVLNERKY